MCILYKRSLYLRSKMFVACHFGLLISSRRTCDVDRKDETCVISKLEMMGGIGRREMERVRRKKRSVVVRATVMYIYQQNNKR